MTETAHPSPMIRLLHKQKDDLTRASIFEKEKIAQGIFDTLIAAMTDYENRIRYLERRQYPQIDNSLGQEATDPTRGENDDGEERQATD